MENKIEKNLSTTKKRGLTIWVIFLGTILIVINVFLILAIFSHNGRSEGLGMAWAAIFPILIFLHVIFILSFSASLPHKDNLAKKVFLIYIISLVVAFSGHYYFTSDYYQAIKAPGGTITTGTITDGLRRFEDKRYGLVFNYPKDFKLVTYEKGSIYIGSCLPSRVRWCDRLLIYPDNLATPVSDQGTEMLIKDLLRVGHYGSPDGTQIFNGKSYPYFNSDTLNSRTYVFVNHGILFSAQYILGSGSNPTQFLSILKNIEFK